MHVLVETIILMQEKTFRVLIDLIASDALANCT